MAELIPLQQLYLMALAATAKSLKMDTVIQEEPERLWFVSQGSTVPLGMVEFGFGRDSVTFRVATRDERILVETIKYAEGLDAFLPLLAGLFQAGRISDKRSEA